MEHKKNDLCEVTITDVGMNGEGIGKYDGYTLFVKDAVVGDRVIAQLTKVKKNYAYARVKEIIEASAERCEPKCEVHRACGGCQIPALSYSAQLSYKEKKVKNDLVRIGEFNESLVDSVFEGIIGMEEPYRYRNKSQYPIGCDRNGNIVAGFYAGRTHSIIPCRDCVISPEVNAHIIDIIINAMNESGVSAYDEETCTGLVRHVLIRHGFATGQIMVCIVVNADVDVLATDVKEDKTVKGTDASAGSSSKKSRSDRIGLAEMINMICERLPLVEGVVSIVINENRENTNVILGNKCVTVYGEDKIVDTLMGIDFRISPLAFYQVNPLQTEKLYGTAIEFAGLTGVEEVWDICCGIGTISLCMAGTAKMVHGVEIVPQAIEDAKENAKANGIENAEFICAPAEEYLPEHVGDKEFAIHADVIVMDPPRKGMDVKSLDAVITVAPSRIVYVSCDPATLARDLNYLCANGYEITKVRCVDMFPHTVHVETVVLMSRDKE